jgi:hypothetical protein
MPLKALPWLRHEMAIMLANHDAGSSGQIEMAPTMPKWILGRVEQPRQKRQQERDAPADGEWFNCTNFAKLAFAQKSSTF